MRKQVLFKTQTIQLSPSSLSLFRECPRCFYLQIKGGIHRPETPFSSLPGGMDQVIKKYFDKYRAKGLPPELKGRVEGRLLADQALLKKWRSWQTGLRYEDELTGVRLNGALDDCLIEEGFYIPIDYKTRGFEPKENSHEFYQDQLNLYTFLLEHNGYKTKNLGYLIFYHPLEVKDGSLVLFEVTPKKVKTDPEAGLKLFEAAVQLLKGPIPPRHSLCQFCSWSEHQHEII